MFERIIKAFSPTSSLVNPGLLLFCSCPVLVPLQYWGTRHSLGTISCNGGAPVFGRLLHVGLCGSSPNLQWSSFEHCLEHMCDFSKSRCSHGSFEWNMANDSPLTGASFCEFSIVSTRVRLLLSQESQ